VLAIGNALRKVRPPLKATSARRVPNRNGNRPETKHPSGKDDVAKFPRKGKRANLLNCLEGMVERRALAGASPIGR